MICAFGHYAFDPLEQSPELNLEINTVANAKQQLRLANGNSRHSLVTASKKSMVGSDPTWEKMDSTGRCD